MSDGKTEVIVDRLDEFTPKEKASGNVVPMTNSARLFEFTFPKALPKEGGKKIVMRELTEGEVRAFIRQGGKAEDYSESIVAQMDLGKGAIYAFDVPKDAAARQEPAGQIEKDRIYHELLSNKGRQLLSAWVAKQIWPTEGEAEEFFQSER